VVGVEVAGVELVGVEVVGVEEVGVEPVGVDVVGVASLEVVCGVVLAPLLVELVCPGRAVAGVVVAVGWLAPATGTASASTSPTTGRAALRRVVSEVFIVSCRAGN
jgi:hypothetical protein